MLQPKHGHLHTEPTCRVRLFTSWKIRCERSEHFSLCGLDPALRGEMTGLMMLKRVVRDIPVRKFRIGAVFSPGSVLTSFKDKIALKGSLRSK